MGMSHDRRIFRISGTDRTRFLQGLVTNDVGALKDGLVYAALLTPQGKYLADFFLVPEADSVLLDVKADLADALVRRLGMYRLRSDVTIEETPLTVSRGLGTAPDGAFADPRHPALGWRAYGESVTGEIDPEVWTALRIEHRIPESGVELIPDESYILEAGFDRIAGVNFRKGCYVGQEVTARMHHKTKLRKGLVQVRVEGAAPVGTEIEADGKSVGTLYSQAAGRGLAHLRYDLAQDRMQAGSAEIRAGQMPA
ncbi:MAG: folate-binding protein YgfZ [Rhodobacteraceae bacterium]|nr:folate-binding protein YgfZ [Paracoccaceae bacterium]